MPNGLVFSTRKLNNPPKSKVQFRFIVEVTEHDLKILKSILKMNHQDEFDFRGRTPNLSMKVVSSHDNKRRRRTHAISSHKGMKYLKGNKTKLVFGQTAKP